MQSQDITETNQVFESFYPSEAFIDLQKKYSCTNLFQRHTNGEKRLLRKIAVVSNLIRVHWFSILIKIRKLTFISFTTIWILSKLESWACMISNLSNEAKLWANCWSEKVLLIIVEMIVGIVSSSYLHICCSLHSSNKVFLSVSSYSELFKNCWDLFYVENDAWLPSSGDVMDTAS